MDALYHTSSKEVMSRSDGIEKVILHIPVSKILYGVLCSFKLISTCLERKLKNKTWSELRINADNFIFRHNNYLWKGFGIFSRIVSNIRHVWNRFWARRIESCMERIYQNNRNFPQAEFKSSVGRTVCLVRIVPSVGLYASPWIIYAVINWVIHSR